MTTCLDIARAIQRQQSAVSAGAGSPPDNRPVEADADFTTIKCPWCGGKDLLEGDSGLWCYECERLAWVASANRITRADCLEDIIDDRPQFCASKGVLKSGLLRLVTENRPAIFAHLGRVAPHVAPATKAVPSEATPLSGCRCGESTFRDVLIHGGRSTRRDCARCDRFLIFTRWNEATTTSASSVGGPGV